MSKKQICIIYDIQYWFPKINDHVIHLTILISEEQY